MEELRLGLPEEFVRALGVEADLLGFESTDAYLRWVVRRRLAIDVDGTRGRRLAEYRSCVGDLEPDDGRDVVETARRAARAVDPADGTDAVTVDPSVTRVEDDTLVEDADALAAVEGDRLRLFGGPDRSTSRDHGGDDGAEGAGGESGEYRSRRPLDEAGRPGEAITDLDEIEVPGWDEDLIARRREAVGAALAFLSEVEEAKRGAFVDRLYEEYPAGYESESAWWECIKRGLRQVDRVVPAGEGSRIWQFRSTAGRVTRISYA